MAKNLFIKTKDKDVAEELKALGYELIQNNGSEFVFINDSKIQFDTKNMNDVITSDVLCV